MKTQSIRTELEQILFGPFTMNEFKALDAYMVENVRMLKELRLKREQSSHSEVNHHPDLAEELEAEVEKSNELRGQMLELGRGIQLATLMFEIHASMQQRKFVVTGTGVEHCGQEPSLGGRLTKQFATAGTRKEAETIALQLGEHYGSVVFEVLPTQGVLPIYSF